MEYHKLYQAVTPITAAEQNVVSLLEQISTYPGNWYVAVDLENAFLSISVSESHQKSFLSDSKSRNTLSLSYLRGISALQPSVII